MNRDEFNTYVSSHCATLDLASTNKKFLTMSPDEQRMWIKLINKEIMGKLSRIGIPADSMQADNTHIALSIRLLVKGKGLNQGPHNRINGEPHECYANCISLIDEQHAIYYGYALNRGIKEDHHGNKSSFLIWIPHAWMVNKTTGKVSETTNEEWLAYFGVPVTVEELQYVITTGVPKDAIGAVDIGQFEQEHTN